MIEDPLFYAAAVPAVILVGLSKGGFGGSMSLLALPLMALVISPIQAAGVMLPILIAMDVVAVWTWRRSFDRRNLVILLPAAVLGTAIGWATASLVSDAGLRLAVGGIGLLFTASWLRGRLSRGPPPPPSGPSWPRGLFWGTLSGVTSFISHVGGPPFQIYFLPQRPSKEVFAGTSALFFAFLNAIKVGPFWLLGQLSPGNLATSAALMPVAVGATALGAWLVRRVTPTLFFGLMYGVLAAASAKLVLDGLRSLAG